MRINKVNLINYRNHTETAVEFVKGINLILGRNGAGKSSVLEAIGYALYDVGIRTTNKEALNIESGSSYAIIRVEISAPDGNDYLIERRLGSQPHHHLFFAGEASPRLLRTDDVVRKIKELTGIDENAKNIYENLISCYQNRITNIFSDTPAERKKVFDKIFNTDIYERIEKGDGLKALEDKYAGEIRDNSIKKSEKEQQLKDDTELAVKLDELTNQSLIEKEKYNEVNQNLNEQKIEKDRLDKIKVGIDKLEAEKKNLDKQLISKQKDLGTLKEDISKAEKAQQVVTDNKQSYEAYKEIESKFNEIDKAITELDKKDKEKQKLEKELERNINDEIKLKTGLEKSEENLKEIKWNIELKEKEINGRKEEVEKSENNLKEIKKQKDKIELVYNNFNNEYGIYKETKDTIKELESQKTGTESNLIDLTGIDEKLQKLIEDKSKFVEHKKIVEDWIAGLNALDARLKDNESAAKKLKSGECPFLKENCLNIKENDTSMDYFELKKQELEKEQNEIKEKLLEFGGLDEKIKAVEKGINQIDEWKIQNEKTERAISDLIKEIELKSKDVEIQKLKLKSITNDIGENILEDDLELILKYIQSKFNQFNTDYESNKKVLEAKHSELDGIEKRLIELKDKSNEIDNSIKTAKDGILTIDSRKKSLSDKINVLKDLLLNFEVLKQDRTDLKSKLDELSESYNLYTSNINKANELESLNDRAVKVSQEIEIHNENLTKAGEELVELTKSFSPEMIDKVKSEIKAYEEETKLLTGKIATTESEIRNVNNDIIQNKLIKKSIKELDKKIRHLEKKKVLTANFRKNLRDMGKIVASRLIERIEIAATENYRNISGKGEYIKWLNNESDSYAVYLDDTSNRRGFGMLSGGEQVSVALSLRAAMASLMTKANFTIFDEPTINLDVERRAALAESLGKILNNLEQAIIVTHDDSFREMAGKIIEL
jgi:DNA repair protein SbcC/Rad50